ncbi:Flp pilus assembly complex ATPase component TadA [Candidatus Micrarchaeota archaeon]|nr:Flp pilus assembly complex ATPase component TadA [Candidatus Micrarchaeota archaeon]
MTGEFVVKSEGGKKQLVINYKGAPYGADIALYAPCMKDVIEKLREVDADEVVLSEYYERIYNEEQTRMLKGIGEAITKFESATVWSPNNLGSTQESKTLSPRHDAIMQFMDLLPSDPFRAYLFLVSEIKTQLTKASSLPEAAQEDLKVYLKTLAFLRNEIEKTEMIQAMKRFLEKLSALPADRNIYHSLFEAAIKPSFIGSRIFFSGVENLQLIDQYEVLGSTVHIYKHPEKVELLYYVNPPEYTLAPEKYFLLEKTKEVVSSHRPSSVSFLDMQQARKYFRKIYMATINDLAQNNGIKISAEEKEELATIVSRYTIGYGILEIILSDRQITDVYIDSPLGEKPIYLVHSKYGQCQTNVIYSDEESKGLVSRFRALSGRPFDEAHPILDFDMQDLQTRVAAIGRPLAVDGNAFALRLHKETPWTLAQFLDFKMFNPFAAGLLSFLVDAQASTLIVGSRGAGKCLDGKSQIQLRDGKIVPIGEFVEGMLSKTSKIIELDDGICTDLSQNGIDVKVSSMDSNLLMKNLPIEKIWRRNAPKSMVKLRFKSGKELLVTEEHPFFTIKGGELAWKRADEFELGQYVATPRSLELHGKTQTLSMLHPKLKYSGVAAKVGEALKKIQWERPLAHFGNDAGIAYSTIRNLAANTRKGIYLSELKAICEFSGEPQNDYMKSFEFAYANTTSLPLKFRDNFEIGEDFGRFVGLLAGDGHLDEHKTEFTNTNEALRQEFIRLAKTLFDLDANAIFPANRSPSANVQCKPLFYILRDNLGFASGDKASILKIPDKILASPDRVLAAFIAGYFDCDSSIGKGKNEIEFSTASKAMVRQMQMALQRFGIVSIVKPKIVKGTEYYRLFIRGENAKKFAKSIPMHHPEKVPRLLKIALFEKFNPNIDVIPDAWEVLAKVKKEYGIGKLSLDQKNITPKVLQRIYYKLVSRNLHNTDLAQKIRKLAFNDIYWDEIESIEKVPYTEKYVYDLTVGGTHSFVANGVIVHNTSLIQAMMQEIPQNLRIIVQEDTLELPVHSLKHLGFSIQRLKTRAPLGQQSESDVSAEDALRTALRLGDSVLIVGEVRSGEARALFEAMRVGAVGNVVMGTIHGESAYSIWDRIVNDLGVPTTSFKATDFAVVATQIRFKGSLKRARRLIEVTEVKKHWTEDPDKENGFLHWLQYDAGKDDLEFFEDRMKESEWLPKLQKVRGLKIEQIWNEINARAESKQYLVDLKRKYAIPKILEAENSILAHSYYMLLGEKQREEFGSVDHKELIKNWKSWIDDNLAKPLLKKGI